MIKKRFVRVHPNSIKNLRVITSPAMARELQKNSVESRKRNTEAIRILTEEFKCSAEAVKKVLSQVDIKAIDVLKMSMMHALNEDNFEDAARYAKEIAEFEQPKLSRLEQTNINKVEDMTDEELQKILKEEGL